MPENEKRKADSSFLTDTPYTINNLNILHAVGINSALFLQELFRLRDWAEQTGELTEDGFFCATIKQVEMDTTLSQWQQDEAKKLLQNEGYITMQETRGSAKRRFKINLQKCQECAYGRSELYGIGPICVNNCNQNLRPSEDCTPNLCYKSRCNESEIPKENRAGENTPDLGNEAPPTPKRSGLYKYTTINTQCTSYISSKDDIHSVQPQPGGCSEEFFYGRPQVRSFTVEPTAVEPTVDSRLAESTESSSCESTPSCSREAPARSVSNERRGGVTLRNTPPTAKAPGPKTKRSAQQKVNAFITRCEKQAAGFQFDKQVLSSLSTYFRMLAGSGALLPEETIKQQLTELATVPSSDRVQVIQDTVSSGWKSLRYAIQQTKQQGTRKSNTYGDWSTDSEEARKELELERERRLKNGPRRPKEVF